MHDYQLRSRRSPRGRLIVNAVTDDGRILASSRRTHDAIEPANTDCERVLCGQPDEPPAAEPGAGSIQVLRFARTITLIVVLVLIVIKAGG